MTLMRPAFTRTEAWLQAVRYTAAVMSDLPRRNGWTIAKFAGDRTPDRTQRLLNRASWDEVAAMSAVRRFAVAGLDEAARQSGRKRGLAVGGRPRCRLGDHAPAPADAPAPAGSQRRSAGAKTTNELGHRRPDVHHSLDHEGLGAWLPLRRCPRRPGPVTGAYGVGSAADP